jgi:hypothetical protein
MHLHSVVPLVALLGLVHFRVPLSFLVLGGRCGVNNGRIHNGTAPHHEPRLLETLLKKSRQPGGTLSMVCTNYQFVPFFVLLLYSFVVEKPFPNEP